MPPAAPKPYLTVVSVLDVSCGLAAAELAARLRALRACILPHVDAADLIVVANGGLPFAAAELAGVLDAVPDVQVFVLADEADRDVAFVAGIESSLGDAVLTVDLDGWDPTIVGGMIEAFRRGCDVVLAESTARPSGVYWAARSGFLKLYRLAGGADEKDVMTQKVLSRAAVTYVLGHGDAAALLRTLAMRSGFRTERVVSTSHDHAPRGLGSALAKGTVLLTSGTNRGNVGAAGVGIFALDRALCTGHLGV